VHGGDRFYRMAAVSHKAGLRARQGAWWRVHRALLLPWIEQTLEAAPDGAVLKTDLFDEASGPHHFANAAGARRWLGIDLDLGVARAARRRLAAEGLAGGCVVADVRRLPFAAGGLAAALSLSTLDHFEAPAEISAALQEIGRALRPGGRLLLTLDNPANPEVTLRAHLPARLVARLREDTFHLGITVGAGGGARLLAAAGWIVERRGFLVHSPRWPAIRLLARLESGGRASALAWALRGVVGFERLARTPLARLSGHYTAWIARRPGG
jgi:SAM-dependent methyltransferase